MRRMAGVLSLCLSFTGANGFVHADSQSDLRVNQQRLTQHIEGLSHFGRNPQGGVSRVAFSQADRDGREYVKGLMRDAGLQARVDAAGNIIGRREGSDPSLPPILFGSHIDSVPEGGNYDGDVGSLGAVEVVQTLKENNIVTRHPLEVIVFCDEESGLVGSRSFIGEMPASELEMKDKDGRTLRERIQFIGGDPDRLARAAHKRGDYAAYLELHIEQGGTLDTEKIQIGVVEGIVGIDWYEVTIDGFANHAGTTPMNQRHDALLAAAKLIEAVNRVVTSIPGRQVATVGRIAAFPGAPNVIPGRVVMTVEIRDLSLEKMGSVYELVRKEADKIAAESGTKISFRQFNHNIPAPTDPRMRAIVAEAARELGLSSKSMPSGAGHDAQEMARIMPAGMIFVPSAGGISHSPKEYTRPEDCANGANVLLHSILKLDLGALK